MSGLIKLLLGQILVKSVINKNNTHTGKTWIHILYTYIDYIILDNFYLVVEIKIINMLQLD